MVVIQPRISTVGLPVKRATEASLSPQLVRDVLSIG
jgi:hypothetical protein